MEKSDDRIRELNNIRIYEKDQRDLKKIFQRVKQILRIPAIDPNNNGYIINVGCGESPDQIALQAFNVNSYTQLPIVGISVDLAYPEGVLAAKQKLRHFDNVDFIGGDAAVKIPEIVAMRGKTSIIVARNPDILYRPPKGNTNPLLETSWDKVFQTVFDNLPEDDPGYFVVTCKGSQEKLVAEIFMSNSGFVITEIRNPNKKPSLTTMFDPPPMIESDQYIVIGIKNIPDHLLDAMQETYPGLTREAIKKSYQQAKAAELKRQKELEIYKLCKRINKTISELQKDKAVNLLLSFLMRQEIDISEEQIKMIEEIKNTGNKRVIIRFSDIEDLKDYENLKDKKYSRGGLFKRATKGSSRRFFVKDKLVSIGLTTYTDDKNNEDLDIIRVFLPDDSQDDSLKMIEKLINLENS